MVDNSLTIKRLSTADVGFEKKLASLLQREILTTNEVTSVVSKILGAVRHRGDQAVIEYTKKFDGFCA
ncbi:MAG: histidinol dehydrogenase, partial [Gammaproteobacteria bacterium]|nr:histidinol dehydrogenase [Gammaproteobacteria bacterium]